MMQTIEDLRRFRACIAEGGLIEGVDYVRIEIDDKGDVSIVRWGDQISERVDQIVYRAFALSGLTEFTYEEWLAS